ncbi:hypothetical protein XcuCFBP2542_18855, partial [Xanthomonas cucurbitae]
ELAAQYLTKTLYGDDPQAYGPDGKFDPNRLSEADKQMIVSLSQAVGAIAGGMTGGSLADAATTAEIAKNSVENNWLTKPEAEVLKILSSLCRGGSEDGCDAEKKLIALDKIRDEEKNLYSDKVTDELRAAGKLTLENYDEAMEPYWKDQGFFVRERDVVYSGDALSRTFPTYGELIYNKMGETAGDLKYAQPGTAVSLLVTRGLLAGLGQTVAGWKDLLSSDTSVNYFTGESVVGLDALDARVLSLADILTFGLAGASKARPVITEIESQIDNAILSKAKPSTRPSAASADADSEAGLPVTLVPLPVPRNASSLAGGPLENASQVSGRFKLEGGPHNGVLYRADNQGNITSYATYDGEGMILKRVDVTGSAHAGVPTPHVIEYGRNTLPDGVVRVQSPSTNPTVS